MTFGHFANILLTCQGHVQLRQFRHPIDREKNQGKGAIGIWIRKKTVIKYEGFLVLECCIHFVHPAKGGL